MVKLLKYPLLLGMVVLAGCSSLGIGSTTNTDDMAKAAYTAKSAYAIGLVAAVQYNRLPRCGKPDSPLLCSDPLVVAQMRKASDAADIATQAAEDAVRNLGKDPTIVAAAVVAATQSVKALRAITDVYGPK